MYFAESLFIPLVFAVSPVWIPLVCFELFSFIIMIIAYSVLVLVCFQCLIVLDVRAFHTLLEPLEKKEASKRNSYLGLNENLLPLFSSSFLFITEKKTLCMRNKMKLKINIHSIKLIYLCRIFFCNCIFWCFAFVKPCNQKL